MKAEGSMIGSTQALLPDGKVCKDHAEEMVNLSASQICLQATLAGVFQMDCSGGM